MLIIMVNVSKYYKIEDGKLIRVNRTCPKCGPGYFLGTHYDRYVCGRCHYTVFKRKGTAGSRAIATGKRAPRKRLKKQ